MVTFNRRFPMAGFSIEIRREEIPATVLNPTEPDPNWRYVDAAGHGHFAQPGTRHWGVNHLDPEVFRLAADLLEDRGLLKLKDHEWGVWYHHQLAASDSRKGRTSTVGAIRSACVHQDQIPNIIAHLRAFGRFAGVEYVAQVEAGRATAADVAEMLRACAAQYEQPDDGRAFTAGAS